MSWQIASMLLVALVLAGGFFWYERSRPSARIVAAVAALAALAVAGRVALAPIPNVVATTDVVLLTGYCLGPAPGFAVGALVGLISNFWLGQGPWTPWQMAGWGMIGIGGGALALLTLRRLGRIGLALVAAISGLAYGALLDLSVMVTYGGEQSLDRYLALSARGIPFNLAHAAGNAALMLAVGPAMVRMLDRFRARMEVDWGPPPVATASGAAALLAIGMVLATPLQPPSANAAGAERGSSLDASARYLIEAQNPDGGFGIAPDSDSNAAMTGWAMLGLESAGINPLDVSSGGRTAIDYLEAEAAQVSSTGDMERTILALEAAGVSSRAFAGRDLVAELLDRRRDDGSYQRQVNLSAYAIVALRSAGVSSSEYGNTAAWLRKAQNSDHGWGSFEGAASEPDSTGAVLQALAVAPGDNRLDRGVRWLRGAQLSNGGYSLSSGAGANSQSTAWAAQGLVAAGVSPSSVRSAGKSPLDYLAARQAGDGHVAYSEASDQTPVWVTAQAAGAMAEEAFPPAVVARAPEGGGSNGGGSAGSGGGGGSGGGLGLGGSNGNDNGGIEREDRKGRGGGGGKTAAEGAKADGGQAAGAAPAAEAELGVAGDDGPATDGDTPSGDSIVPSTPVLLGGLAALALVLGAGWLVVQRRLP